VCGSGAWPVIKSKEGALDILERKILQSFYGAVYNEQWSSRYCHELYLFARNLESLQVHEN
jgi:hypothetical protein